MAFFNSKTLFTLHHTLAYGMLGCALNDKYNISTSKIIIRKNENGKPFLFSSQKNIKISVSHSGHIVAVALSRSEIGIDVQKVDGDSGNVFCYEDFFAYDEMKYIDSFPKRSVIFAVFWTRKEALIKRLGLGICDGLRCSCFNKATHSFMINSILGQRYAFSYSFSGSDVDIYRYDNLSIGKIFAAYKSIQMKKATFN